MGIINVCVVVPIFKRFDISLLCIKRILKQTVQPFRVVVVGSEQGDRKITEFVNVDYIERPNYYFKEVTKIALLTVEENKKVERATITSTIKDLKISNLSVDSKGRRCKTITEVVPFRALGDKVQAGVYHCRYYNPDAIMLCGSDDLLSLNWIEKMSEIIKTYDVVGTDHVYTMSFNPLSLMINSYKGLPRYGEPTGPGRMVSSRVLEKLNWELYPPGLSQNLDSNSFRKLKEVNSKFYLYTKDEAKILSVKGPWDHITTVGSLRRISCEHVDNPEEWIHKNNFSEVLKVFYELVRPVERKIIEEKKSTTLFSDGIRRN